MNRTPLSDDVARSSASDSAGNHDVDTSARTSESGEMPVGFRSRPKAFRRREVQRPASPGVRQALYDIIFEADSAMGRGFDIGLLIAIIASIVLVSLETLPELQIPVMTAEGEIATTLPTWLIVGEWFLTLLFTGEYVARLACVRYPLRYALSFWGIVDLLSVLPTYAVLFVGS